MRRQDITDIELIELFTGDPELANEMVFGDGPVEPLLREVMRRIMNIEDRLNPKAWKRERAFKCEGGGTG